MNHINEIYDDIKERINACIDASEIPVVMELAQDLYSANEFTDSEYESLSTMAWNLYIELMRDDDPAEYDLTLDDFDRE